MRDRLELILKCACWAIAALLIYQLIGVAFRVNPLRGAKVPELPSLPGSAAGLSNAAPAVLAAGKGTNKPLVSTNGIQLVAAATSAELGTSRPHSDAAAVAAPIPTNLPPITNIALVNTNSSPVPLGQPPASGTNVATLAAVPPPGTNIQTLVSNSLAVGKTAGSNAVASHAPGGRELPRELAMSGMGMNARSASDPKAAPLAPEIQARINRIYESEILGAVTRPLPMALLGIAGDSAFLRGPTGQTGLVKEGDQLGGIKLVRIGTNRVLVEQDGQKKELTIFSGFGGDSLLPVQETHP
ncbi:MAG TPA: hypothetical protein VFD66_08045 [Verrucomicrobiae bacterium]|nr:hypothetical protein [Verrucomicrobiae bacterium]